MWKDCLEHIRQFTDEAMIVSVEILGRLSLGLVEVHREWFEAWWNAGIVWCGVTDP